MHNELDSLLTTSEVTKTNEQKNKMLDKQDDLNASNDDEEAEEEETLHSIAAKLNRTPIFLAFSQILWTPFNYALSNQRLFYSYVGQFWKNFQLANLNAAIKLPTLLVVLQMHGRHLLHHQIAQSAVPSSTASKNEIAVNETTNMIGQFVRCSLKISGSTLEFSLVNTSKKRNTVNGFDSRSSLSFVYFLCKCVPHVIFGGQSQRFFSPTSTANDLLATRRRYFHSFAFVLRQLLNNASIGKKNDTTTANQSVAVVANKMNPICPHNSHFNSANQNEDEIDEVELFAYFQQISATFAGQLGGQIGRRSATAAAANFEHYAIGNEVSNAEQVERIFKSKLRPIQTSISNEIYAFLKDKFMRILNAHFTELIGGGEGDVEDENDTELFLEANCILYDLFVLQDSFISEQLVNDWMFALANSPNLLARLWNKCRTLTIPANQKQFDNTISSHNTATWFKSLTCAQFPSNQIFNLFTSALCLFGECFELRLRTVSDIDLFASIRSVRFKNSPHPHLMFFDAEPSKSTSVAAAANVNAMQVEEESEEEKQKRASSTTSNSKGRHDNYAHVTGGFTPDEMRSLCVNLRDLLIGIINQIMSPAHPSTSSPPLSPRPLPTPAGFTSNSSVEALIRSRIDPIRLHANRLRLVFDKLQAVLLNLYDRDTRQRLFPRSEMGNPNSDNAISNSINWTLPAFELAQKLPPSFLVLLQNDSNPSSSASSSSSSSFSSMLPPPSSTILELLNLNESTHTVAAIPTITSLSGSSATSSVSFSSSMGVFSRKFLFKMVEQHLRQQRTTTSTTNSVAQQPQPVLDGTTVRDTRLITLLAELPFVFAFEAKVRFFYSVLHALHIDQFVLPEDFVNVGQTHVRVRRSHIYDDAFGHFSNNSVSQSYLRANLRVNFVNEFGAEESGIDGGGLTREFLIELVRDGFHPNRAYFAATSVDGSSTGQYLYPNPDVFSAHAASNDSTASSALFQSSEETAGILEHFVFLGKMLGKVIFDGILVDLPLAPFVLAKIVKVGKMCATQHHPQQQKQSQQFVEVDYLQYLDMQLYKNLFSLLSSSGVEGSGVSDMNLNFTTYRTSFGRSQQVELKPGGSQIAVTEANKYEYVALMARYRVDLQIRAQMNAFMSGLNKVIPIQLLALFNPIELQTLISGTRQPIDVEDLRANTVYNGVDVSDEHPTIKLFWSIVREEMSEQDRSNLIRFVTSCPRAPMLGFGYLRPLFGIQLISDLDRLPSAHTCFNQLKLPALTDRQLLAQRILYAIRSQSGFDLS